MFFVLSTLRIDQHRAPVSLSKTHMVKSAAFLGCPGSDVGPHWAFPRLDLGWFKGKQQGTYRLNIGFWLWIHLSIGVMFRREI